jgi:hypothetical protein
LLLLWFFLAFFTVGSFEKIVFVLADFMAGGGGPGTAPDPVEPEDEEDLLDSRLLRSPVHQFLHKNLQVGLMTSYRPQANYFFVFFNEIIPIHLKIFKYGTDRTSIE